MNVNINIGLPWILSIVFMVLKLCGVIDWSWWLVAAPLWGTFLIVFIPCFILELIKAKDKKVTRNRNKN